MIKVSRALVALTIFISASLICRDVLLEFKGAAFLPTNDCVKDIYGDASALYGPEITFQLCSERNWYGFASADFLSKKGHSIGLCTPTEMKIVPLGFGLKYFVPFCYGDFYVGLGFQPLHLKTINCVTTGTQTTSKWGFGGIAKIGAYFDVSCHFFIDLFVDYSFVSVGCNQCTAGTIPVKVNMNGAVVGAGIGYRFD